MRRVERAGDTEFPSINARLTGCSTKLVNAPLPRCRELLPNRTPSPRYLDACDDDNDGMSFQIELRRRAIIQPRHRTAGWSFFSFTTNCDNKEVEPAWMILDKITMKYYADCVIIISVSAAPIIGYCNFDSSRPAWIYSRRCNCLLIAQRGKLKYSYTYISLGKKYFNLYFCINYDHYTNKWIILGTIIYDAKKKIAILYTCLLLLSLSYFWAPIVAQNCILFVFLENNTIN